MVFDRADGTYPYSIPSVGDLTATTTSGSLTVSGLPVTQPVTFALTTHPVTFTETGLVLGTNWSVSVDQTGAYSIGLSVGFRLVDGTYTFSVATDALYTFAPTAGSFTVAGAPLKMTIAFRQSFVVTFRESGLSTGTSWSVTFNGTSVGSNTATAVFYAPEWLLPLHRLGSLGI